MTTTASTHVTVWLRLNDGLAHWVYCWNDVTLQWLT